MPPTSLRLLVVAIVSFSVGACAVGDGIAHAVKLGSEAAHRNSGDGAAPPSADTQQHVPPTLPDTVSDAQPEPLPPAPAAPAPIKEEALPPVQ